MAPAIALIIALQAMRRDGGRDWWLPAGVAALNLVARAVLIGWLTHLYGNLVLERFLDVLDFLVPGRGPSEAQTITA
ncbi:hypothetical protein [Pararhodobacter sp. SW119]|uniref:hypothetical protein n=1 Tax=Pararhodobacter sp. SW119 TaxID=2780075 RepID=UPI001ADFE447|nr:hypothetical protein [Pararhodobacter sp. SW119]